MGGPTSSCATAGIALRISGALKPHHHDKVETPSVGTRTAYKKNKKIWEDTDTQTARWSYKPPNKNYEGGCTDREQGHLISLLYFQDKGSRLEIKLKGEMTLAGRMMISGGLLWTRLWTFRYSKISQRRTAHLQNILTVFTSKTLLTLHFIVGDVRHFKINSTNYYEVKLWRKNIFVWCPTFFLRRDFSCVCNCVCIIFILCSVSFIACVVLCAVLFCVMCVILCDVCCLCVVSYCITTGTW
jgi:hypothetical protein